MRKLKIFWIILAAAAGTLLLFVIVFLLIGIATEYRPDQVEKADCLHADLHQGKDLPLPDRLKILTWNIGYGGLGDNMDFFYDGGSMVRDTRERVTENTEEIIRELKRHPEVDIFLLQEVDLDSKRSWGIDQTRLLKEAFPEYHQYFAYCYRSFYVPVPLRDPVGKVASGVLMLSRYRPDEVLRHQYPTHFPFPVSIFHLKKCLMTARFTRPDGSTLIIGNTHNTAYDKGNKRSLEMSFIAGLLKEYEKKGWKTVIGGDWNQYPGDYRPAENEDDVLYSTVRIEQEKLDPFGKLVYDPEVKTLRHLNTVLNENTVKTITDYFFISTGISAGKTEATELNFRNSDHNPVLTEIRW